jgi:uncharacterized protein (UPF0264 family)
MVASLTEPLGRLPVLRMLGVTVALVVRLVLPVLRMLGVTVVGIRKLVCSSRRNSDANPG